MKQSLLFLLFLLCVLVASEGPLAHAAWVLKIDTDNSTAGSVVSYHPNFAFGGDTTAANASVASTAVGMTGGNSIFGGNGVLQPDTYTYKYTPAIDGNNLFLFPGQALNNNGDVATGATAGGTGRYRVYATWPRTINVSGGLTRYVLTGDGGTLFSIDIDQNTINDNSFPGPPAPLGGGGEWVLLGRAQLAAGSTYQLTQQPTDTNLFVSMRSAGILFDRVVPEPTEVVLAVTAAIALLSAIRRRNIKTTLR